MDPNWIGTHSDLKPGPLGPQSRLVTTILPLHTVDAKLAQQMRTLFVAAKYWIRTLSTSSGSFSWNKIGSLRTSIPVVGSSPPQGPLQQMYPTVFVFVSDTKISNLAADHIIIMLSTLGCGQLGTVLSQLSRTQEKNFDTSSEQAGLR